MDENGGEESQRCWDNRRRRRSRSSSSSSSPTNIGQVEVKTRSSTTAFFFLFVIFLGFFLVGAGWMNAANFAGGSFWTSSERLSSQHQTQKFKYPPLKCYPPKSNKTWSDTNAPPTIHTAEDSPAGNCPEYFRWIHEDLRPWKDTGITREMVERANETAHIRIVVVNGRVYVDKYMDVYQTRDVFTLWGFLQLFRFYTGKLPDLDIMFECSDMPTIRKHNYTGSNAAVPPPPLFHYCGDDQTYDIVVPDWSFWGWQEINIKPWEALKKELKEGNSRIKWENREPYAYWKGTVLCPARRDLADCNVNATHDWNARVFPLNWTVEQKKEYKNTDLANQCNYRYKIYVEGNAWSVSEKYIVACDSVSLFVTPHYYDFFTRELLPTVHYWPIDEKNICRSVKFAVDWGNHFPQQAQKIGRAASEFIQEKLQMKYVYDYMFHVLNNYAKLLKYKPTVPENAQEISIETLGCSGDELGKAYKMSSSVESPSATGPCSIPPPYDPQALKGILERKTKLTRKVEMWEAAGDIGKVKLS